MFVETVARIIAKPRRGDIGLLSVPPLRGSWWFSGAWSTNIPPLWGFGACLGDRFYKHVAPTGLSIFPILFSCFVVQISIEAGRKA